MEPARENFMELSSRSSAFIYPNEVEIHWSILIVVYPYITGLGRRSLYPCLPGQGLQRQGSCSPRTVWPC